jgi:SAM-dependent methyltransferase
LAPQRSHDGDPLSREEREEHEDDLISFSDRELDLLGNVTGLEVLYAGGSSPLWLEGLSQRVGKGGSLTALDVDAERIEASRELLRDADLAAPVRLVAGDVFRPPFEKNTFDLVYSAGFFHELDVDKRPADDALAVLAALVRPGGRVATSDFVDGAPAAQLEDEELERELARETQGAQLWGIGDVDRLVALHETLLEDIRWRILPPFPIRHLDKSLFAEREPEEMRRLPVRKRRALRERRERLWRRVEREGYTRPVTLYVEGFVPAGD